MSSSSHQSEICPDPAVHSRFSRDQDLQNNASKAALLAAESKKASPSPEQKVDALGPDGKLSSAGAATSLRYAKAQDLPSFPSVGIETQKSGFTAATLANQNYKSPAYPSVESSSSAGKAATLAARDGGKLNLWQYKPDSTGNTAASLAMGGKSSSPQLDYGYTEDGHKKALLAATQSIKKKDTAPPPPENPPAYPDSANSGFNALNAASVAHRPSTRQSGDYQPMSDKGLEASRFYHASGQSPSMYGSKPPVQLEEDEKRHQAALKAAAVSAAKQLYEIEKPAMERIAAGDYGAKAAYGEGHAKQSPAVGDPVKAQAMNYLKVQEAAQKLAADRLAKLDPDGVAAYQEHYGYGNKTKGSRRSMFGSRRGRNSQEQRGDDSSDDEAQAAKIRAQTKGLNEQVVDQDKRKTDRQALLAAAQKNIQARLHDMDEQVFNSTGKMSPQMTAEWEAKAQAKAAQDSEQRMLTHGKVHIGGGKYMDQSEIDAIAQGRMQPTLDEINETAALQQAREAEVRLDAERRAEEARLEKERKQHLANEQKVSAARDKAEKDAVKAEEKRKRDEEKAERDAVRNAEKQKAKDLKAQEKQRAEKEKDREREVERLNQQTAQQEREDKEKESAAQREVNRQHAEEQEREREAEKSRKEEAEAAEREEAAAKKSTEAEEEVKRNSAEDPKPSSDLAGERNVTSTDTNRESTTSPTSPASPTNRRESKLKGFFSRMRSKKEKEPATVEEKESATAASPELVSEDKDVDAYKSGTGEEGDSAELTSRAKGKERADSISSVSSDEASAPPRDSTLSDDKWSEARDTFEEEPPRVSTSDAGKGGSKFQEQL